MADDQVKYSELLVKDEDVFGALIKEINDAKKAMADLKQEAAGLAGSVKNAGTATRDQQQAVASDAAEVERLSKQVKDLTDKIAKLETKKRNYKKLTDEEAASVEALRQALQGEAQQQIAAVQAIDLQTKSYNELYQTYNALKDALNAMTLAERQNSEAGKAMVARSKEIYDTLNSLQQATGKYTLNVGNYQSAFSRLQFQAQQLMREAPSAISLQQFFLAISNNLPMFTDALTNFKAATKDMKARLKEVTDEMNALKKSMEGMEEGSEAFEDAKEKLGDLTEEQKNLKGQSMSTGKALVKSIVSWQTAILVGIMLLQKFGSKIVDMFANIFKGTKEAIDETKLYAEMNEQAASSVGDMTAKFQALRKEWQGLKQEDQGEWLKQHKDDWSELGISIDNVTDAENLYVKNTSIIQNAIDARARSIAAMKLAADKYEEAFKKQMQAEQDLKDRKSSFGSQVSRGLAGAGMAEGTGYLTPEQMAFQQRSEEQAIQSYYDNAMKEVKKLQDEAQYYITNWVLPGQTGGSTTTTPKTPKASEPIEQTTVNKYWEAERALLEAQKQGYELESALTKLNRDKQLEEINNWYIDQRQALQYNLEHNFITQEQYDASIIELDRQNKALRTGIANQYNAEIAKIQQQEADDRAKTEKKAAKEAERLAKEKIQQEEKDFKARQDIDKRRFELTKHSATEEKKFVMEQQMELLQWRIDHARALGISPDLLEVMKEEYAQMKKMYDLGKYSTGKQNIKGNYSSISELLWPDLDKDQTSALNSVFDQAKEALNSWMDARKAAADQAKELADDEVSAAEQALNREIELRNQGYANDVALRERELADAKKAQKEAAMEQQKIAKEQVLLDAAMQASSMITASANILKNFPNPVAWVPMLATMWGAFAYAKVKAYQSANKTLKFREGGVMLLEGGSHESGHDVNLGIGPDGSNLRAEGGEYFAVINKRNSRRYGREIPGIVNALNSGVFEDRYIKTSDAAGLVGAVGAMSAATESGRGVDLSAVEKGVQELVKQGDEKWSSEGNYRVMRYKNLTRRVRVN